MKSKNLIAGLMLTAAMFSVAGISGDVSPKLQAFADKLGQAQTFSAKYTIQQVGGASSDYSVSFAKPNQLRIESAESITVADGSTIFVFDKGKNTYFKKKQDEKGLMTLFSAQEFSLWKPFFNPAAVKNYSASKDAGTKEKKGKVLNVVNVTADPKGESTITLLTDSENVLQQAVMASKSSAGEETLVMMVNESSTQADASLFAFTPPANSQEVQYSSHTPGVFTTDFWAALEQAKAEGKMLMVDFMASWCGPCKMMDAEVFHSDKFKEVTKDFILVKVDVDVQTDVAKKYGITAMPTVKFIRGDGSVAHEFVGYGGPEQVYSEISTAKGKK